MAVSKRADLLTRTIKVLKKYYKPVPPAADRTLIEHLLFACCLENSMPPAAEQSYATLKHQFYDWNEVRVSTIGELAEVLQALNDPEDAARRLRGVLQSVFESLYAFDLEALKKHNMSQAVKQLQSHAGTTPFAVSYVVQAALGGHAIPVNEGAIRALVVVGAITAAEANQGRVPGLERALPKIRGIESGSLLHQWGVDFRCHPYAPATRKRLLEIAADCKDRLPKRPASKPAKVCPPDGTVAAADAPPAKENASEQGTPAKEPAQSAKKTSGRGTAGDKKAATPKQADTAKAKPRHTKKSPGKRLSQRKPR
ncbi:MAG: hypothetical protein A2W31_12335 [Planctomycetes bacterium RBG_16_64_10]|nr:MAG: hypothetical protein A2W31_12335 [Planctomycetes bacterium RBG_16_64_10]